MDGTTCSVCYDLFSPQPPRRPKILPCGHSTCEQCIHQWTNRSNPPLVQCPHCRRRFRGLSLDNVPVNFALLDVLANVNGESRKRKGQDEDEGKVSNKKPDSNNNDVQQCEISNGHCTQPATHRCMECPQGKQFMCKDHLFHHSSFKAVFASHKLTRIEDLPPSLTSSSSSSSSSVRRTCSDHISQALTVYCWDCSKAVCDRCALFGHKNHSYSEIHQAADRMKKELKAEKNGMEERMRVMKQMADSDLEVAKSSLESKSTELLRMTDRMFDEIREALEMMRTAMKKRVIDQKRKSDGELNRLKEELITAIARGEEEVKKMEAVLEEKDEVLIAAGEGGELMRKKKEGKGVGGEEKRIMENWEKTLQRFVKETKCAASIDLDRMNETKMMMEEGMKAALASYWGGFKGKNDSNSNSNSIDEKKRKKIEYLVSRRFDVAETKHLQIDGHVNTSGSIFSVVWSLDGESLYVKGENDVSEINIFDGSRIRTVYDERIGFQGHVALSERGNFYAIDSQDHKVYEISGRPAAISRTIGSKEGGEDAQFNNPYSLCVVDEWDELYVCDTNNHRVRVFSMISGRFLRKFSTGRDFDPTGISVDARTDLVFVSECGNDRIQVFDREGRSLRSFGSYGRGDGQLDGPHGIVAIPATKEVIVCDSYNDRLCVFDYEGRFKCSVAAVGMETPVFMSLSWENQLAICCDDHHGVFFGRLRD